MKNLIKILAVLSVGTAITSSSSFGQYTVDEWGGAIGLPPGFVMPDPTGGIPPTGGPVLVYPLPFPVTTVGDIGLVDGAAGGTNGGPSDILRFFDISVKPGFPGVLIFYSDRPEPGEIPPPADTGLPTQIITPIIGPITEIGTEAFNYAIYTAFPGMPGWDGNPAGTTWTFISDGVVPEPSTCALMGLGGFLAILKWRKRK